MSNDSNSQYFGMSGVVPDTWQRSHISCITWHTIVHTQSVTVLLIAQHSCHGSKKEVSTVNGTVLVKTVTLGELHNQIWMLCRLIMYCIVQQTAVFLLIVTVDTQSNIKGKLSVHSVWWFFVTPQYSEPCLGKRGRAASVKPSQRADCNRIAWGIRWWAGATGKDTFSQVSGIFNYLLNPTYFPFRICSLL